MHGKERSSQPPFPYLTWNNVVNRDQLWWDCPCSVKGVVEWSTSHASLQIHLSLPSTYMSVLWPYLHFIPNLSIAPAILWCSCAEDSAHYNSALKKIWEKWEQDLDTQSMQCRNSIVANQRTNGNGNRRKQERSIDKRKKMGAGSLSLRGTRKQPTLWDEKSIKYLEKENSLEENC